MNNHTDRTGLYILVILILLQTCATINIVQNIDERVDEIIETLVPQVKK